MPCKFAGLPGYCSTCNRKALPGRSRCRHHADQLKKYYDTRRAAGACVQFGCDKAALSPHVFCGDCLARRNADTMARKRVMIADRRAAGQCYDCGGKPRAGLTRCAACATREAEYRRRLKEGVSAG